MCITGKAIENPAKTVESTDKVVEASAAKEVDTPDEKDKDKKVDESPKEDNKTSAVSDNLVDGSLTDLFSRAIEQPVVPAKEGNAPGAPAPEPPAGLPVPPVVTPVIPVEETPPPPILPPPPSVPVETPATPNPSNPAEVPPTAVPDADAQGGLTPVPEEDHSSESIESEEVVAPPKAVGHAVIFQNPPPLAN